ncbi:UDP-3-O-(3-hydroxymyristoyl)glucosamine N-acyltransferase [Thalassoglobus sp.]|uniref:UDP-3-O-(3-hydroxymyristoyl)glucosamine N-acyltransferase n=1 Tax=Thalassoglobus sp. TaxID=2795869 RepID=UPI003AA7EAB9
MPFTLRELAESLNGSIQGDAEMSVTDVAALEHASPSDLSYLDSKKQLRAIFSSSAGAILTTPELAEHARKQGSECNFILVDEPQAAFIEAMLRFRPLPERSTIGLSAKAEIHETAQFGHGCHVFPNAYIGKNVVLGSNCEIGPGAVIHDNCVIGDDCVIHANAVLYHNVTLGDRVILHAGAVIGADGFGYRFVNGGFVKIPHTGTVIIENDVEIGAVTTVDRGMIGATVIGQGTKLDNQVMIAHNCQIGKHNAYASQVGIAGSCTIGDYVQMGGQVGVVDHVKIGSGAKFGGKAGVAWDMPAAGTFHGTPAINEKEAIRNHFSLQKLPELREQVKALTNQLAELQEQLAEQHEPARSKSAA